MKRITNLITHGQEFILASTTKADAFNALGAFVAIRAEDFTDGKTNRPLTGLDIVTADSLPELMKACDRSAKHSEWIKAHPMPAFDHANPSPEVLAWFKADLQAWGFTVLQATH
jgi:hypothetical protein